MIRTILEQYTRSELFGELNWSLRVYCMYNGKEGLAEWQQKELVDATPHYLRWRPVVWHMSQAVKRSPSVPGLYYRGVSGMFRNFGDVMEHKAHEELELAPFTSSTVDPRIAGNFMYGASDPSKAQGVIFKIRGKSPAAASWCSFVPEEAEYLFLPGARFKIIAWYPMSESNLRRGMRKSTQACQDFVLDCENLVVPVPLDDKRTKEGLQAHLEHNNVVLIEMEEIA